MDPPFARELWRRLESVHAVTYFAPEARAASEAVGLRGFWRCYFGFRAAPLGRCSAGPVVAAFFGFAPSMVERAIPSVFDVAEPEVLLDARVSAAAGALRRLGGSVVDELAADGWLAAVLDTAIAEASPGGRPLFAANRDLVLPDDPVGALWQRATTLREHRGDGHVAIWAAEGLSPIEVGVLFVADGGTTRESLQPNRGWTDDEWQAAADQLADRGLVDGAGPTAAGAELRSVVERRTDALAEQPFRHLSAGERQRLLDLLTPVAMTIAASATIPAVNPMGVRLVGDE